jgi:hypothetical protein
MSGSERPRTFRLAIPVESDDDLEILRGALLAARATELSEIQRRAGRLSYGYGSDSARDTMTDEVGLHQRRRTMIDRLLTALEEVAPKTR